METRINLSEIALLTTVANFDLYKKTRPYQPAGIRKLVIDGREGMYGLDSLFYTFEKLPLNGIKWLILADEDVLFLENKALIEIIKEMDSAKYTVAGIIPIFRTPFFVYLIFRLFPEFIIERRYKNSSL